MWVCPKNSTLLVVVTLGVLMASGCSGHSVRYGANSEGDEMTANQDENTPGPDGTMRQSTGSTGSVEGDGINGGSVNGANPYLRSSSLNPEEPGHASIPLSSNNEMAMEGEAGTAATGSANYGHNYAGVDGSGPHHGAVSGFGDGLASNKNPDPEAWANAYLGNGKSQQEFYGDPSKAGTAFGNSAPVGSSPPEGVDPATWAESYAKENGGPSPEYVNPDMSIAHANGQQSGGSVGIGRINGDHSIQEASFGDAMGYQQGRVQDIYFAFDSWSISRDAAKFLEEGAQWLQANPGKALTIEGHCDQRGTQDYNLVLGQKRAEAAREYLVNLGVQPDRIKIVSYGKERPFCQNDSEDCFQENRRNHMVVRVN
jgi:peptidoglycan-associated lipoprotein